MFGASASSRISTFSSMAASFSSVAASHCRRCPASCQTARHRAPSERAGYTVTPHPSSITSPLPRWAARPLPLAKTGLRRVPEAFLARADGPATGLPGRSGTSCGETVGILKIAAGACATGLSLFLR
jgi:hypothetical protein